MLTASDESVRAQSRLAAILAFVAGYIDSFTLHSFKVYTSFMSGNTTQAGLHVGQGQLADAGIRLLPIPSFVIGIFVGTLILHGGLLREGSLRHAVRGLCALVGALLAISAAATYFGPLGWWGDIIVLAFAMGVMNTTITHVGGQPVSIGFVTGDLNNLGRHLALAARGLPLPDSQASWDTPWWRASILAGVWGAFLLGATVAGVGMLFVGKWMLLPPTLVLGLLAFNDGSCPALTLSRTTGDSRERLSPVAIGKVTK